MPGRFLSQAEREQLSRFPSSISENDLIVYFTLTPADLELIQKQREAHNRLGFALLLCALRYLGFFPSDLFRVPRETVTYLAQQLKIDLHSLKAYGQRAQTRREHQGLVMIYLQFRRTRSADREILTTWLTERALEHERPSLLLQLACERLYRQHLVRPAATTMERLVILARQRAQQETYRLLAASLSKTERHQLDALLTVPSQQKQTQLHWLRKEARGHTAADILDTLAKLNRVQSWPFDEWKRVPLPPSRLKFLAQLACRTSNQCLQRMSDERRYPILVAFLAQAREHLIDEVIEIYDECLAEALRKSKRDLKAFQLASYERLQQLAGYFHNVTDVVLDDSVDDDAIRPTIYKRISPAQLVEAHEEMTLILKSRRGLTYLDFFDRRYSYFRRFSPTFLQILPFRSHEEDDSLLAAIHFLCQLNQEKSQPKTLEDVPVDFVPRRWHRYVFNSDGTVKRRGYELCVLSEIRDKLRSGDLWVEGSRRYAELESYLIPAERWPALRQEFCQMVGVPMDGQVHMTQKQAELEQHLARFDEALPDYEHVRIEKGELIVSPLEEEEERIITEEPALANTITESLPHVQLAELFREVDTWTQFSLRFKHAGGSKPRVQNLARHLYATILAQACNMDLLKMAEVSDLSYRQLIWCKNWYIREETLQAATNVLVNFQYRQPLSQYWGDGTLSSSDGQRFVVKGKTRIATPLPRYFGYGRGLTFLTWTSDQLSQYATRVTPPTIRDSTYILDAILDNESDLDIKEHTTDTAGYTDLVFALFDLLGLQFSPRLRDIGGHNLYCIDLGRTYEHISPLLTRSLSLDLIVKHWDELLRVAASLKMGWVTASLLIRKLQAFPRQHRLTQLLQEYGRLVKTIFILRYLASEPYRRRILVQLNKGEGLHRLRRFLFFDNLGRIRGQEPEVYVNQAGCLNVLTNAVVVWNTVYMQAILEQLKTQSNPVDEADFAHLSPVRYGHINPYGKFRFEISVELAANGLRPLRLQHT